VQDLGFVESNPKQDGRNMIMVLGPHKKKTEAMAEAREAQAARKASRQQGKTSA
jgi:translation initiation factor IF-3